MVIYTRNRLIYSSYIMSIISLISQLGQYFVSICMRLRSNSKSPEGIIIIFFVKIVLWTI